MSATIEQIEAIAELYDEYSAAVAGQEDPRVHTLRDFFAWLRFRKLKDMREAAAAEPKVEPTEPGA